MDESQRQSERSALTGAHDARVSALLEQRRHGTSEAIIALAAELGDPAARALLGARDAVPLPALDEASLAQLGALTGLTSLSFERGALTAAGLAGLAKLETLERLRFGPLAQVEDAGLEALAQLPALRDLELDCDAGLSEAAFAALARIPQLESLVLAGQPGTMRPVALAPLGRAGGLKRLTVHGLKTISDADLEALCALTRLEALSLRCWEVSPAQLRRLSELTQLRSLELWVGSWEFNPADEGYAALGALRGLRRLALLCSMTSEAQLADLAPLGELEELELNALDCEEPAAKLGGFAKLERLVIRNLKGGAAGDLAGLPGLTALDLRGGSLEGGSFARIDLSPALERLALPVSRAEAALDAEDLQAIGALPSLAELTIHEGPWLHDELLAHLNPLPALTTLRFSASPSLSGRSLQRLASLHTIERLELVLRQPTGERPHFGDEDLAALGSWTRLRELTLQPCSELTSLDPLVAATELGTLHLERCVALGDDGLGALTALDALRSLTLVEVPKLTDAGLALIALCAGLEQLKLTRLQGITDVGLRALSRLTQLRELDLSGLNEEAAYGDEGLDALATLPKLQRLNLCRGGISEAAVARFQALRPGCELFLNAW